QNSDQSGRSPMPEHRSTRYRDIVERVVDITRGRMDEPLRIADIGRAAGVSPRTLVRAFRAVEGITPSQYLCALRLAQVRRVLLSADGGAEPVTDIAMRFGFRELGRFAALYRRSFGESPSATLRRASADVRDPAESPPMQPRFPSSEPKPTEPRKKLAICP